MCRTNITPKAVGPLARLLAEMADSLAAAIEADPTSVVIGPVDFGPDAGDR